MQQPVEWARISETGVLVSTARAEPYATLAREQVYCAPGAGAAEERLASLYTELPDQLALAKHLLLQPPRALPEMIRETGPADPVLGGRDALQLAPHWLVNKLEAVEVGINAAAEEDGTDPRRLLQAFAHARRAAMYMRGAPGLALVPLLGAALPCVRSEHGLVSCELDGDAVVLSLGAGGVQAGEPLCRSYGTLGNDQLLLL